MDVMINVMRKYYFMNIKGIGKVPVFPLILIFSTVIGLFFRYFFPTMSPVIKNLIAYTQLVIIVAYVLGYLFIYLRAVRRNKAEAEN